MSPLTEPTKLTLAKTYVGIDDPDAADYIAAVEAADEAASPGIGALETATKVAIHSFVKGCKADGIWPAIKASCILAGARTLEGALVPLAGTAPNKFGTAANWNYNRKDGLQGDGSTNYLDSNRANNADPQNNNHNACWVSSPAVGVLMASSSNNTGQNYMDTNTTTSTRILSRNSTSTVAVAGTTVTGLYGHSRSSSSVISYRCPQGNGISSSTSQTPESRNVFLYSRSNDGVNFSSWSTASLAFYSIGEALDLALLDTRVSDLITAFGAAIP